MMLAAWLCVFVGFVVVGGAVDEALERSSVLYGVATIAAQVGNKELDSLCYKELIEFSDAANLKRVWAYKMMDISGRPTQGFLGGNNGWTGQSTVCADLTNKEPLEVYRAKVVQLVTDYDFPPYELGFIAAFMRHNNSLQLKTNTPNQNLIHLGLCTPLSCSGEEVQPLLEGLFRKKVLTFQKLYDTDFKIESIKTVEFTSAWLTNSPGNLIIFTIIIFGILIFVAAVTYYDLNIYQVKKELLKNQKSLDNKIPESTDPVEILKNVDNIFDRLILCFSLSKTYRLILTSDVPDNVGAINGMMFFGMLHVAVYNYLVYGSTYMKHLPMEFRKYETFFGQIISNSSFSIDTLLFLSGCLVSYNFYKSRRDILVKSGFFARIFEFFSMIAERVFRTLPVYVIWLLWTICLFSYLDARWPAPLTEHPQVVCPQNWWKNILYINNLSPLGGDTCMTWSWVISAEMQYFVVNAFLLVLSTFCLKLSVALMISMVIFCVWSTSMTAYSIGYIHTLDQQLLRQDPIYQQPWHRIGPYIIGMLTGLALYKLDGKLPLRKKFIWLCWAIAPLINLYLIFGLTGIKPSVAYSSLYIGVGRTAWAVGLAWMLIACSTGHAGYVNDILSYGGFKMFHRLSYSTYILMVINIILICITFETTIYLSTMAYCSQILSLALFPYLVNVFFTMHYEIPFELIWKVFVKK